MAKHVISRVEIPILDPNGYIVLYSEPRTDIAAGSLAKFIRRHVEDTYPLDIRDGVAHACQRFVQTDVTMSRGGYVPG